MSKKTILIIMDGWGLGSNNNSNAIYAANTPFVDSLSNRDDIGYSELYASGEFVGLPDGQMGNSEVGHMNIGAGRIVYQDLVRINKSIQSNSIANNPTIRRAFNYAKEKSKKVHFLGLVSDGGVHSSMDHLKKLVDLAEENGIEKSYIHALMDGRDTDPNSGLNFIKDIENHIKNKNTKIASVCGRYYTMDRDKRWERIKKGYDLMVHALGHRSQSATAAIEASYKNNITDEFIEPVVILDENNKPTAKVEEGDVFICFNFRTDRLRQITTALTQKDMPEHRMQTIPLEYITMTPYDSTFRGVRVIFDKLDISDTIAKVLSKNNKTQLRIAETEKYAHVTFFFNGGREEVYPGEERIMVSSPKVATYDLQPEMSAPEVAEKVVERINKEEFDFIVLNFANADMVGHTGVYEAIIKAIETVDSCVEKVITAAEKHNYSILLTSDHGNSDFAVNEDGSPNTAHSTNKVPIYLIDKDFKKIKNGKLGDLAPTILSLMEIKIPKAMSGDVLI
jgi:2,3-bisphosphoglycerate-independent phosphoglycerate mutase